MNLLPAYGQVPELTLIATGVFRPLETRSGNLCHKPMGLKQKWSHWTWFTVCENADSVRKDR